MPRVKRGVTAHASHKKVLDAAKGYRGRRKNVFRIANEAVMKAGQYAYRDRRQRKRQFRQLWIARINAAVRALELGMTYSVFMNGLKKGNRSKSTARCWPTWPCSISRRSPRSPSRPRPPPARRSTSPRNASSRR
jgi:large subunit ribosomal protein L20